ncbi:MAG: hypothetical protein QOG68_1421 [Solirubrobacteraceae bacterium]|nr:hypothetical protein [Solirubrobacteraceae bacterium]
MPDGLVSDSGHMHIPNTLRGVLLVVLLALVALSASASALTYVPEPRPFSSTSFWDTQLPATQTADPNSPALVAELNRQVAKYGPWIATDGYTAPVYTVPAGQPRVPVILDTNKQPLKSDLAAGVPIPAYAQGSDGTDNSAVVWQPSTDTYWEFWRLSKKADGFHATFGGIIRNASTSQGIFSGGTGTAASGLALLGGMIRPGEFGSWTINHALRMGMPEVTAGVIRAPANRTDGRVVGGGLPMGTRFQLDPSVNVWALNVPNQVKIIAYAAQRYGMIVGDTSGAVSLYGEDPLTMPLDPWSVLFSALSPGYLMRQFPWDKLRALPPTGG